MNEDEEEEDDDEDEQEEDGHEHELDEEPEEELGDDGYAAGSAMNAGIGVDRARGSVSVSVASNGVSRCWRDW